MLILTKCSLTEFQELPHYRWLSLPNGNELKIGRSTVAVKIGKECSFRTFKNGREAHSEFEKLLGGLKNR